MVKRIITFCLLLLLSCTTVLAEPESRWKWYYSSDRVGMYFDTQTLHYDASKRAADVWTKNLNVNGEKIREVHKFLFLEEGAAANVQYVYYRNGYPSVHNVKKVYIQQVAPDSPNEALANGIANYLNVKPMYPGGENRWKWIGATDTYSLYLATDCGKYYPEKDWYAVWIKRVYLNGYAYKDRYYCRFSKNQIATRYGRARNPIPESDDEKIYNAAKELQAMGKSI